MNLEVLSAPRLALDPADAEAKIHLANARFRRDAFGEVRRCWRPCRRGLVGANAKNLLGVTLARQGRIEPARGARAGAGAAPDAAELQMNRLLHLNYDPERSPAPSGSISPGRSASAPLAAAARLPAGAIPTAACASAISRPTCAAIRSPTSSRRCSWPTTGGRSRRLLRLVLRPDAYSDELGRWRTAGSTSTSSTTPRSPPAPRRPDRRPGRARRAYPRQPAARLRAPPRAGPDRLHRLSQHDRGRRDRLPDHRPSRRSGRLRRALPREPDPPAALLSRLRHAAPRRRRSARRRSSATATSPSARSTTWPRSIAA